MKQDWNLRRNRFYWIDVLEGIFFPTLVPEKVRKHLTMSMEAIKWFTWKFSDLNFNLCPFVLLEWISLDNDIQLYLEVWNSCPYEPFEPLPPGVYKFNAAIVVYSITHRRSFEEAKGVCKDFTGRAKPGAFVALVGDSADLESEREVSFEVSNVAMFIWYHCATFVKHEIT